MPFATAASLAFLIQDGRWGRIGSPFGRRLADVLVLVGALGLALYAVRGLQYLLTGNLWAADVAVRNAWLTAVIAAGLGYMIPDVFRRPLPRGAQRPRAAAPPSPAHPAPSRASVGARA
jgi:uncharacterized membrane protein YeiH